MKATKLPNETNLFSYVTKLVSIDAIILVAVTRVDMRDQVKRSNSFRTTVPTHDYTPSSPYVTDASFKTTEHRGWMHLTFYRNRDRADDYPVGVDLHAGAKPALTEHSPRLLYDILKAEQSVVPSYSWLEPGK